MKAAFDLLRSAILDGMVEGLDTFLELVDGDVDFEFGDVSIESQPNGVAACPHLPQGTTQVMLHYSGDSEGELSLLLSEETIDRLILLLHGQAVDPEFRSDTLVELGNMILNRLVIRLSRHHGFTLVASIPFVASDSDECLQGLQGVDTSQDQPASRITFGVSFSIPSLALEGRVLGAMREELLHQKTETKP